MAYTVAAIVSGVLHALWETLHVPLYMGYEALGWGLPIELFATTGDVLYTCAGIFFVSWITSTSILKEPILSVRTHMLCAGAGFVVALFVEYKAFYFDRWSYTEAMPMIPFLEVGLSPVIQMTVLIPLTVYLTRAILKTYA